MSVALLVLAVTAVGATPLPVPKGVFSLPDSGNPAADASLTNPDVVGIAVRNGWRLVEPVEGQFDWSFLDAEVARATNAGKKIILRVPAGGVSTPSWVFAAGVKTFTFTDSNPYHSTYNQTVTIPVFWDPILLAKKSDLMAAMGAHFAGNSTVVMVGVSGANATTDDWNVPNAPADIEQWKSLGYTSSKLITACEQQIDTAAAAFPQCTISMAVGQNGLLDATPDTVASAVVSYALSKYSGRFIVQKNTLSAQTPDPMLAPNFSAWRIMNDNEPQVAAQMMWDVTNDTTGRMNGNVTPFDPVTTLQAAVDLGLRYRLNFEEIYEEDVLNPNLAGVIHYASTNLAALPTTTLTSVWLLKNGHFSTGMAAPTIPSGWSLRGVADFDGDGNKDYVLFNPATGQTTIWYMKGTTLLGTAAGPVVTAGFDLVTCGDFNHDGKPDLVVLNRTTRQTAMWQMNNTQLLKKQAGPRLPASFDLICCADFNADGNLDYVLFNAATGQTTVWYLTGNTILSTQAGPRLASNLTLVGAGDFNGDRKPDFVYLDKKTGLTTIQYLNSLANSGKISGPPLPKGAGLGAIVDFDGAGQLDFVITNQLGQ